MNEDGSTLTPLEGSLQVFSLDPTNLAEYGSSSAINPQLSPNGLYPGNHNNPGVVSDLLAGVEHHSGVGMGYNHPLVSPDLGTHYLQEQKNMIGSNYYDNHFPDNLFGPPAIDVEAGRNIFKGSPSEETGYVDMLNSSGDGVAIKKEKMDFDNHFSGMPSTEFSSDMPFLPNTCVPDWNYYHNSNSSPPSYMQPIPNHQNMHYQQSNMSNHFNHSHPGFGLSNLDLHNQAKKITQGIIESNWSSENLYKSQVYNNMANDTIATGTVRKRKQQPTNDSGPSRVRKRKASSSNLEGHSKTVASILLSEQNQPTYINISKTQNGEIDASRLDSGARDEFVTSLMNNLRTTVQFESFCLSFPKKEKEELAFKHKVFSTADLLTSVDKKGIRSVLFPEIHTRIAEKNLLAFKQALSKTEKKIKNGIENQRKSVPNCTAEMVEEQMPHSMLWAARLDCSLLTAHWEGQFVASVNPIDATMCFSVFQFSPLFSTSALTSLHQGRMSKELAQEIIDNMQQFEVSRQLRLDLDLHSIKQMYLHAPNGDDNEAVLILVFEKEPEFYQRWLHTSAEDKNKWQTRSNFFAEKPTTESAEHYLYLGGLLSELNELVALLFASIPSLKDIYHLGLYNEFRKPNKSNGLVQNGTAPRSAVSSSTDIKMKKPAKLRISDIPFQRLRQEIVEILVHFKILDSYDLESYFGFDSITQEMCNDSLDITFDDDISECFRDYVNYKCGSARELSQILEIPVMARKLGFSETDYHMDKLGDQDIDTMTVAELIKTKCSNTVYYSFCWKEVGQLGHDRHCSKCHQCTTWKYWHCKACSKCSEGGRLCQYCGYSCDNPGKIVIKPLSVYKTELEKGTVSLNSIKPEWDKSLTQSDDDSISWGLPDISNINTADLPQYNTHNAMKDQLGLLDPVGFMFGQKSASRKHRRNKVSMQILKPEFNGSGIVHPDTSGAAGSSQTSSQTKSSCNIQ